MNIKHLFSTFALASLLAACTSEDITDRPLPPTPDGGDDANRREVLLTLKNKLSVKPTGTKAEGDPIATDEENYIRSLDVYVFGSTEENGTYTFQELHYYRDDASEVNLPKINAYSFNLISDPDNSNTTTGLLKLNKGLFIKLYCVANRTTLYQTDATGAIVPFDSFASLEQSAPGQAGNNVTPGSPTLTEFLKLHTKLIDPTQDTEDDVLQTPLPMTGAYTTPLDLTDFGSAARTQISFKLSRMVARFDIINDASKSKFTVEKMSMGKGQSGAQFFPIQTLTTDPDKLITYPEREVSAETQKTKDETAKTTDHTPGAFYCWPSPKDDHGYLTLKGKYAVNQTEQKEVSYQIPFQQIVDGIGTYIEVAYNHRYTIQITKADTYHLDFNLLIADWDDNEGAIDQYTPENEFDTKTPVKLETAASTGAYVLDNGQISLLARDNSTFSFKMGSNTELTEEIVYKAGSAEWIVAEGKRQATPISKAISMETTFGYKTVKEAIEGSQPLLPVTIRLTNPASGDRKEIVVIPTPGPAISLALDYKGFSKFDPDKLIATIYNVVGQTVKLHVVAESRSDGAENPTITTGSSAAVKAGDAWLTASSDIADAEGDYTLTLGTAQSPLPASTTVDFTSTASTEKSTVTVQLKKPDMEALVAGNFNVDGIKNTVDMTGGTGGIPKVSLVGRLNNLVKITVTSPEGVTAEKTTGDWLTVKTEEGSGTANGMKQTIITATITDAAGMADAAKTDGKITITNPIDNTTKEIEVVTTVPAGPTLTMKKEEGSQLSYLYGDPSTGWAIDLANVVGQTITLITNEPSTITTEDGGWLTITSGKSTKHVITVNTAQAGPFGQNAVKATLTFVGEGGGKTKVVVNLVEVKITAVTCIERTEGVTMPGYATPAAPATVTMADPTKNSSFTLMGTSNTGCNVDMDQTSPWLIVTKTEEEDRGNNLIKSTFIVTIKEGTDLTNEINDGKIVLKNTIGTDGEVTINVVTTVTPTPAPVP